MSTAVSKQSIGLVSLQVVDISLGLFAVIYVAANISPELYALVGVHSVIIGIVTLFSNTGIETYASRNVLSWISLGDHQKPKIVVAHAFTSRFVASLFLQIPVLLYSVYMSQNKYMGQHLSLFVLMGFSAIPVALSDTSALILRSYNRFISAALTSFMVKTAGKFIAVFVFYKFGFYPYLITYICFPMLSAIPFFVQVRGYMSFRRSFSLKLILRSLKSSYVYAFTSYTSYLFHSLDRLAVSILVPAEIFASYSIGKRLLEISNVFFSNVFDPMIQKLVRVKHDVVSLARGYNRVLRIQNFLLVVGVISMLFLVFVISKMLNAIGISKYQYLNYHLIIIALGQLIGLAYRSKSSFIMKFYEPLYNFKLAMAHSIFVVSSLLVVSFFSSRFIFSYVVLSNLLLFAYVEVVFRCRNGINHSYIGGD